MGQMINPSGEGSAGYGNYAVPYLLTLTWQTDAENAAAELAALDSTQWVSPAAAQFRHRTLEVRTALGGYTSALREVMACAANLDRALTQAAVKARP